MDKNLTASKMVAARSLSLAVRFETWQKKYILIEKLINFQFSNFKLFLISKKSELFEQNNVHIHEWRGKWEVSPILQFWLFSISYTHLIIHPFFENVKNLRRAQMYKPQPQKIIFTQIALTFISWFWDSDCLGKYIF